MNALFESNLLNKLNIIEVSELSQNSRYLTLCLQVVV